jgi:hypothetical protein
MSTFADVFQGGSYPHGISDSAVSRWETGATRVPGLAIRRYEELLGLPRGTLAGPADMAYRQAAGNAPRSAPTSGTTLDPTELDQLLERASSTDPMSGADWDDLTGNLLALPRMFLPGRMWTELAVRLLEETMVADGVAWLQRYEAVNRLLGHSTAQTYLIDACAQLVREPGNQVFVEPTSVLDATAHPDATAFLLHELVDPVNERSRYGALLACSRKVRLGHFSEDELERVITAAVGLLGDAGADPATGPLAVHLLRQVRTSARPALGAELRRALGTDRVLHEVQRADRLLARDPADLVVERIIGTVVSTVGNEVSVVDDILPTLVDEMLYAPALDTRLQAAILVRATPYVGAVAAAVAAELARPSAIVEPVLAGSLLATLRTIGGAEQRPLVERLVLTTGVPAPVALAATHAVAHVGGQSPDAFWLGALARYGQQWRRGGDARSAEALRALVYALGIARNRRLLTQVRTDRQALAPARDAAGWWLRRPARLLGDTASVDQRTDGWTGPG